jgi:hypothetical protein
MKQLFLSNIIAYVKARLDELSNNDDALLVASDQAVEDLEKEIEAVVVPSVRKIHLDAPNILLRDGLSLEKCNTVFVQIDGNGEFRVEPQVLYFPWEGGSQDVSVWTDKSWTTDIDDNPVQNYVTGQYVCFLEIPNDFLRLITLKMNDWGRPIQTFVGEDSVEYRKQQNKYLRGTPRKPIGVLTHGASGVPVAELFTCTNNSPNQVRGQYYPEPWVYGSFDGDCVDICQPLEYPCLHQITANVLRGLGRVQEAMMYEQMAVQPFRIDPDWARLNPIASERFNVTQ